MRLPFLGISRLCLPQGIPRKNARNSHNGLLVAADNMFMKIPYLPVRMAFIIALSTGVACSRASILSVTGNDTLVGNRPANLISNGSFEADGGVATNYSYWATGTGFSPTVSLSGWTASGQVGSYAVWGSDGLGGINNSAPLPHGTNGLYFGGGIMAMVNPFPTEANNGLVTFASAPVIVPKPTDGPVTLKQTVSGLNPCRHCGAEIGTERRSGIGEGGQQRGAALGEDRARPEPQREHQEDQAGRSRTARDGCHLQFTGIFHGIFCASKGCLFICCWLPTGIALMLQGFTGPVGKTSAGRIWYW